ncbi:MAG: MFS transporter [Candidatus Pacebacteria bacterium]|nr:MFS transporter [Candidatus Paceibacterota bacterium]
MSSEIIQVSDGKRLKADEALTLTKGFGKYQIITIIASTICLWSNCLYTFSIPFFMSPPAIKCKLGSDWVECGYTTKYICENHIEFEYVDPTENFISHFNLLCDNEANAWLSAAVFIGCFPGYLTLGLLSDVYGRIPMIVICIIGCVVTVVAMVVASYCMQATVMIAIIGTAVKGFFASGLIFAPFTLAFECLEEKYVPLVGVFLNVMDSASQIIVVIISLLGMTWRSHCIAMVVIMASGLIPLMFIREQPKYHISKQNRKKSTEVFSLIAKVNGTKWRSEWELDLEEQPEKSKSADYGRPVETEPGAIRRKGTLAMLTSKPYFSRFALNLVVLVAWGILYYGVTIDLPNRGGDTRMNAAIDFGAEAIAYITGGYLLSRYGYFVSICWGIAIAGFTVLVSSCLPGFGYDSAWINVLMYISKFGTSITYTNTFVASDTLFPPKIRNTALSVALGTAGLGEAAVSYLIGGNYRIPMNLFYLFSSFAGMFASYYLHDN